MINYVDLFCKVILLPLPFFEVMKKYLEAFLINSSIQKIKGGLSDIYEEDYLFNLLLPDKLSLS